MKHALVLFSSPHKDGYTKKLLEAFLDRLKGKDWQVKSLDICKVNIHPCIACGYCQKADGCAFRDLDEFDRDLRACDLLVIATPVYNLSFPAQLKAVIDRFQRYFEARFARGIRPAIATHRDAVLLLTMGRYDPFAVEVCEKTLRQSFSVMNTTRRRATLVKAGDLSLSGRRNGRLGYARVRRNAHLHLPELQNRLACFGAT